MTLIDAIFKEGNMKTHIDKELFHDTLDFSEAFKRFNRFSKINDGIFCFMFKNSESSLEDLYRLVYPLLPTNYREDVTSIGGNKSDKTSEQVFFKVYDELFKKLSKSSYDSRYIKFTDWGKSLTIVTSPRFTVWMYKSKSEHVGDNLFVTFTSSAKISINQYMIKNGVYETRSAERFCIFLLIYMDRIIEDSGKVEDFFDSLLKEET